MNVLAGLAEGVLDAILEREDDPRNDPFAVALARYRSGGVPPEAAPTWHSARHRASGGDPSAVLRKLDRELLSGVVDYATNAAASESRAEDIERAADVSGRLGLVGSGGPMPSLEVAADGTWHVAASAATPESQHAGDNARAGVPTLASRYPRPRY